MLVISRKNGETIHIGEDIEIVVTQIKRGKIRLGIAAPKQVAIRRGELANHSERVAARESCRAAG